MCNKRSHCIKVLQSWKAKSERKVQFWEFVFTTVNWSPLHVVLPITTSRKNLSSNEVEAQRKNILLSLIKAYEPKIGQQGDQY